MDNLRNDLRFDRNKPRYKTALDFTFWQGSRGPRTDPALLLRITPTQIYLGSGVFGLRGDVLDRYRSALRIQTVVAEINGYVTAALKRGGELSDPTRVRPPAGFETDGPVARFAVRDGFQVIRRYPLPRSITTGRLVPWCAERMTPFEPIHRWLVTHAT